MERDDLLPTSMMLLQSEHYPIRYYSFTASQL
jgi:hypothetical protein